MNERIAYRPVLAGVGIVASTEGRWATLGLIVAGGTQRWGLTALHALGDLSANPVVTISQGPWRAAGISISSVPAQELRLSQALDVAAFPIDPTIPSSNETVGLGAWVRIARHPVVGETVLKVGAKTGLTIGRVESVVDHAAQIACLAHYPQEYALGGPGDSGATWLSYPGLEPLVIHLELRVNTGRAFGTLVTDVLTALDVSL